MSQQTALVTGAGIGIGRATAIALANAGYRAVVTDVLDDEGEAVAAAIRDGGGAAEFHRLDVTDTANADAVVGAVEQAHGALDVIVCNAGIAKKIPLETMTDEEWDLTARGRSQGHDARRSRRRAGNADARKRRHRLPILDRRRRRRLDRTRPLHGGQGWRRWPRARGWRSNLRATGFV